MAILREHVRFRVIGGVREEQADRAEGQRQANLKSHTLRDALLITGTGSKLRWPNSFRAATENFGEMAFEATAADRTPRHGQDGCRWDRP
jgi:hypothetical protein